MDSLKGSEFKNWILYRSVCYLKGKGVTFGDPILQPQASSEKIFSIIQDVSRTSRSAVVDQDLSIYAEGSLDHFFVGPRLENLTSPSSFLREASKKLKIGGHLIVCVMVGNHSPGVEEFYPSFLKGMVGKVGKWKIKLEEEREGKFLLICKKVEGKRGFLPKVEMVGGGKKRVCVCRYGALGDAIIMTPLIKQLWEDGYEVTLNITTYCVPIFENNPYVANVLIQERDAIPNQELGMYWKFWEGEYDRYINLSESLEGDLLQVEGRRSFFTHKEWRHSQFNKNYYDYTLQKGGYPSLEGKVGELFFSKSEERKAKEFFAPLQSTFNIVWALNGSSHHKVYPLMELVMMEWFQSHPDSRLITVGDYMAKLLEFDHPQTIQKAGVWSIREALIATKYSSLVVGPETAITNASGCFSTPKIILLSHSSKENLTKHFQNDYSLEPNLEIAPCYPCHQLHYTKESCPQASMVDSNSGVEFARGPMCAMGAIEGERLIGRIEEVYQKWLLNKK